MSRRSEVAEEYDLFVATLGSLAAVALAIVAIVLALAGQSPLMYYGVAGIAMFCVVVSSIKLFVRRPVARPKRRRGGRK